MVCAIGKGSKQVVLSGGERRGGYTGDRRTHTSSKNSDCDQSLPLPQWTIYESVGEAGGGAGISI